SRGSSCRSVDRPVKQQSDKFSLAVTSNSSKRSLGGTLMHRGVCQYTLRRTTAPRGAMTAPPGRTTGAVTTGALTTAAPPPGDAACADHSTRANDGARFHRAKGDEASCQQYGNRQMFHEAPSVVIPWVPQSRGLDLAVCRLGRGGNYRSLSDQCASVVNQALQPVG